MRIGIEAQRIFRVNKHGMDFVAINYIKALALRPEIEEIVVFAKKGEPMADLETLPKVTWVFIPSVFYPIWEQVLLPRYYKKYQLDVLHCTSNTAPVFFSGKLVTTVHDIIFLEAKPWLGGSLYQKFGNIYRSLVVPSVIRKSDKVLTVSGFEHQNISKRFPKYAAKIEVVYNAANDVFASVPKPEETEAVLNKYNLPSEYILFLGNTDPKKNVPRTLKGYFMALEQNADLPPLIMTDYPEKRLEAWFEENNISKEFQSKIRRTGYMPNTDLRMVIAGATCFLYTSVRESFGIPVLEAFLCKTVLIASNTGSIPEIAQDNAYFVSPFDPATISNQILTMAQADNSSMIENAYYRAQFFSWKESAKKLVEIYEELRA